MFAVLTAPAGALSRLNDNRRMQARLSAFVIWALVAASVAFWGLRLFITPPAAPLHTVLVSDTAGGRVDLTRLLGAAPVGSPTSVQAPAVSSRFQLTGVMAPKVPGDQGVALIAVDGKMPRAYRVGANIDGELTLQSVSLRTASIGPARGAPAVVLELPLLPPPATGSLPGTAAITGPAAVPASPLARPVPSTAAAAPAVQADTLNAQRRARGMAVAPRDGSSGQALSQPQSSTAQ
jgi:general secretion pathway protein C